MIYTILNKLLRKKPIERYQSATALIADLETALDQIQSGLKGSKAMIRPMNAKYRRRSSGRF
jgi:hypothetical protein